MSGHKSVLLEETIGLLPSREGTYVDLTLGRAGHSLAILEKAKGSRLIAFDLDEEALRESRERLLENGHQNFDLIHANFAEASRILREMGIDGVDGIIADLGVSSPQFDEGERGFSYRYDGPLDMRMDTSNLLTAEKVVNEYEEAALSRLIYLYGEEREARSIAHSIVKHRPLKTTFDLVEAIKEGKSKKSLLKKGHPAKQTFQAIRIEVNGELDSLETMLKEMPSFLREGGVMAVISFHSLEDRLVKDAFKSLSVIEGSRIDGPLPEEAPYRLLTKKPILPNEEEMIANPRAKSAKLRAIERK